MDTIFSGITAIALALIAAWISPLGKFQVAKLQEKRDYRRRLIHDGRNYVSSLLKSDEPPTMFLDDAQYLAIRPHLDPHALETIEASGDTQASNQAVFGTAKNLRLQVMSLELDRLEAMWRLK